MDLCGGEMMIYPHVDLQADGTVEPSMWQATDQAVALHRDNILEKPCKAGIFCACAIN